MTNWWRANAHHIPGPDAHQWWTLWLHHTPANRKFIRFSPRFRGLYFHQRRGLPSARSSRRLDEVWKRCHNWEERIESQQLISFTSLVRPFSRGRGTTCKDDTQRNIVSPGGCFRRSAAVSARVYKICPHRCAGETHAGFPQSTEKAKVAMVTLKCPWISRLPSQELAVGLEGNETAVGSAQQRPPPSGEPGRATSKQMKSTRHRKLSLLKSEPLQDFTVLSGTTQNTVKVTRLQTRFRCRFRNKSLLYSARVGCWGKL